jgi:hypothetical protein
MNLDDASVAPIDLYTTPRAHPSSSRIPSHMAGMFLKSELRYPATTAGRYSARMVGGSSHLDFDLGLHEHQHESNSRSFNVPQRKLSLSKSKNFLLKAIGGRGGPQKVRLKQSVDPIARDTLTRRISRSRYRQDPWNNIDSQPSPANGVQSSQESKSRDITDTTLSSQTYSDGESPMLSSPLNTSTVIGAYGNLVLTPQVIVTPECSVVDSGNCIFWVAIELSGVLEHPEPSRVDERKYSRSPVDSSEPLVQG